MKHYRHFTVAEWLYQLENLHQQEIQLGLTRINQVAASLNLLKPQATVISVAGTNGKGSTVAALESLYFAAGYHVASYTSPHLLSFNERIKINKQAISDADLAEALCSIEDGRDGVPLTYFEMVTLAALWHFKKNPVDVMILEVGLGGRLDATNIIDADLAIITTIDLDHQLFLGSDKESIGFEKAGILRPNTTFIYADERPPNSVTSHADSLNCSTYIRNIHYHYLIENQKFSLFLRNECCLSIDEPKLHPNSIAAALMACICLNQQLPIQLAETARQLSHLSLPGRQQWFSGEKPLLLDVSHNPQAARNLAEYVKKLHWPQKIHILFSALKDKDIAGLIEPFLDIADHWYPCLLSGSRAASLEQFDAAFGIYGIVPTCYENPVIAYQSACNEALTGDLIVVYGSFLTVEQVLSAVSNPTNVGEI
ncbi:bifunctional tetrahydrofolate synthase/dihydrofolate synthase [Legionella jordanis]|uniref:Dihydrofolate synthase/folylpolyglutamate synthase n=1 Tax=Legionella jordanis TaxID=456 RepID=A0A0W0VAE3_9GAMM|nr:bifunctional tetrahydrofolate synthase/dihydrofolate synthase [Legionella jordanis]KTD17105.1 dihydrofolate:folylpolyglutamate synthetase FolC [Legionella jordanis]RMX03237.1 bifunctional tetrahydrofolate synthase/dihydrofolate synthase [Legionella jordanis]VEH12698.1 dihydrofolate:folylpolyglutamate synthetase FolC [Legionella jordanis]HAT8713153.1 bifunctional tetrahydrofolate synthase/dihydrofolate synthase [Legionella jordanis]